MVLCREMKYSGRTGKRSSNQGRSKRFEANVVSDQLSRRQVGVNREERERKCRSEVFKL
jgi:hypothetical protein